MKSAPSKPYRRPQRIPPDRFRSARQHALTLLYAFDQKRLQDDGHLSIEDEAAQIAAKQRLRGMELWRGVLAERQRIDAVLSQSLKNWSLSRMAVLDRCLLRLGCYELLFSQRAPLRILINEYIELAKEFGSDEKTPRLVNGILDRVVKDHAEAAVEPE